MGRRRFALAGLGTVSVLSTVSAVLSLNGWHPCPLEGQASSNLMDNTSISAECATVAMPLCHGDVCDDRENRSVDVFVKRIPARSRTSTRNFWFFPDHPFAMSVDDVEQQMALLHQQLRGDVSVYLMDQRGTGRGTLFDCEASQATASASSQGILVAPSEVASCADVLSATFGANFAAAFSLTSAARDVVTFISTFQASTKVVLYGVGVGTIFVERMMHFPSDEIIGFVLDSTVTTSGAKTNAFPFRSRADKDFGAVAKDFLALCDDDTDCSARFKGKALDRMLAKVLEQSDEKNGFCSTVVRQLVGSSAEPASYALRRLLALMLQEMVLRSFVPVVIHRLSRCDAADAAVLAQFISRIQLLVSYQQSEFTQGRGAGASALVLDLIQFSEMWETPSPNKSELLARFTKALISQGLSYGELERYCAFTQDTTRACSGVANATSSFPLSYVRDANWNQPATIKEQASVLLLGSRFDGTASLDNAQTLYDALIGDSKALLVFESAAHNVLVNTPLLGSNVEDRSLDVTESCTRSIVASFVDNDGDLSSYDTSCMELLPPNVSLTISAALSLQVLGVSDPYEGGLLPPSEESNSSSNSSGSGGSSSISVPSQNSGDVGSPNGNAAALAKSRSRYRTAFIVCLVVALLLLVAVVVLLYRARKKKQLEDEELQLRKMRGEGEEDDMAFLRDLYNPSPSEWFNYRSNRMHL